MLNQGRIWIVAVLMLTFGAGFASAELTRPQPAQAGWLDLGDILGGALKIGGAKVLIDEFGDEIDDFINNFLNNKDASVNASTKVVPILSAIGGKHVGAAQIVGPEEAVESVDAVVQFETSFQDKLFRIKAIVPIEGTDVKNFDRVAGVGVSAVIDIKL
jgi:hypothetical protein